MDTNQQTAAPQGTQIQYIGMKQHKRDMWCGSNLTWNGPGDVQLVRDQRVVGKLLEHDDVWRVYDPDAPLPTHAVEREAQFAAASGDTRTLLAGLQVILAAIAKNPHAAAMLGSMGLSAPAPAPSTVKKRLELQTERAMGGEPIEEDPLASLPLPPAPPATAPVTPIVPAVPEAPPVPTAAAPNTNERELLMENLRREAHELDIQFKGSWGPTTLAQAIAARKAQIEAMADGQAASVALAASTAAAKAAGKPAA